jgi:hypothetical protein
MALIDKASLLMVPSTYEAGKLYNVLPSGNRAPDSTDQNSGYDQTRADFDFDRGSNAAATRVNADGLIEKYRENLLLQSEAFSTSWAAYSVTATTGQSGYDGTTNALLLTSTGNYARIQQAASGTGIMTASCYMKAGTTSWAMIRVAGSGYNITQYFDLENGVIGSLAGVSASINLVSDGWYRCEVVVNVLATPTFYIYTALADGNLSVTDETITIQSPQLESGLVATTFIPTTSVTGKAGVLVDLPRVDYSSGTGSLLLEPQRANLLPYSEYFGAWTILGNGAGQSITTNHATSPEGVQNATRIQLDKTGGSYSEIRYSASGTSSGVSCVFSIYLKANSGSPFVYIQAGPNVGSAIELTSEWQRFNVIGNASGGTTSCIIGVADSVSGTTETADILVYGAQLESSASYQTSYIPNHGESGGVTRAADSCSVTGASDVIGQTEGTFFVEFDKKNGTGERRFFFQIGSGSTTIYARLESNNSLTTQILNGGTDYLTSTGTIIPSGNNKFAIGYASNDAVIYLNGTQLASSSSVVVPALSDLYVGSNSSNAQTIAGGISQTALFNERLSNAELATLTTL